MGEISTRTARLAQRALSAFIEAESRRNGTRQLHPDVLAALTELGAASASGRELGVESVHGGLWISASEAARQLGITARSVRRRCAAGAIPAQRVGRDWVIHWTTRETE